MSSNLKNNTSENKKNFLKKQLEILSYFDNFCKKNGLKYYASGGTLLGAIRHKGFIPWDDDIDVVMFRKDYDRLLSIAENKIDFPFFLQNDYSDNIHRGHSELRDSSSSCFMLDDFDAPYNLGCFIDIFVFDYVEPKEIDSFVHELSIESSRITKYPTKKIGNKHPFLAAMYNLIILPLKRISFLIFKRREKNISLFKKFEKECSRYDGKTEFCAPVEYWATFSKITRYHCHPIKDYQDTVYMEFEDLKIPCPSGYDNVLKRCYGDYMKPVKGLKNHSDLFFDANKSYKKYKKTIRNKNKFFALFENADNDSQAHE